MLLLLPGASYLPLTLRHCSPHDAHAHGVGGRTLRGPLCRWALRHDPPGRDQVLRRKRLRLGLLVDELLPLCAAGNRRQRRLAGQVWCIAWAQGTQQLIASPTGNAATARSLCWNHHPIRRSSRSNSIKTSIAISPSRRLFE